MIVIVAEELHGEYPTKNMTLFVLWYGGYVMMPIIVFIRMIPAPLFGKKNSD